MNSSLVLSRRQVFLTMSAVTAALFISSLDQTIVGTAMPRIIADLGGFDRYTWVTTAYMVASTSIVPIIGRLTDIYGRKWFFIIGLGIFLIGSVLAGLSQTMTQLIVYRAIQGLGGGSIMAISFVCVGDLFPPSERGKAQGYLAAAFALSSVLGPTVGGLITDQLSWNWIFYINLPLGIPIMILVMMYFPNDRWNMVKHQIDYLGVVSLVFTIVPLMLALSWGGVQYSWTSIQVLGFACFSAIMAAVFLFVETKAREPIFPLSLFQNRMVSISVVTVFITGFAMFGATIFVPLYFQGVLGKSATSSGSFMTPMMLGMVVGALVSGQLLSRTGGHYRLLGLIGLSVLAVGLFLISRMTADTIFGLAIFNLVVMGFGMGTTFPIYTIAVQNSVDFSRMGIATSSTQFFRSIGGMLGLAIFGSVLTNRFAADFTNSVSQNFIDVLSEERISFISRNPQELVSVQAQAQLHDIFLAMGPQGVNLLQQFTGIMRNSMASAISDVFTLSLVIVMGALVSTLFLKSSPVARRSSESV